MTLRDRVESYKRAYPDFVGSWPIVRDRPDGRQYMHGI